LKQIEPCYPAAYIPYGTWGGSYFPAWHTSPLAEVDIARFAAEGFSLVMSKREVALEELDYLISGSTIPWLYKFWTSPYLSHIFGKRLPGFHLEQACATGLQVIVKAAAQVQSGSHQTVGVLGFDKTSNSPASIFPNSGTYRRTEVLSDVWDNFGYDPSAGLSGFSQATGATSMIACAGRACRKRKLDWKEVAELAFHRYQQYHEAKDSGLLSRWLIPMRVLDKGGKVSGIVDQDTGIRNYSSASEIIAERQLEPGVSPGTQTHASDGMFGMLVTGKERAKTLSRRPEIEIQLIASAEARVDVGMMPDAPAVAAGLLFDRTGLKASDMGAIYDHNPFAVNDMIFAKEFGHDWHDMNNTGSPLVYGHPQGPTLMRVTVEAMERVVDKGGGYALIFGCAAGDVGIAALFKVTDSKKGA
jgi:acetyl-CoA acetyltransferase